MSATSVGESFPQVVVMTPMKNTAQHLERYFTLFENLDYPKDRLRLAIIEGDSTDHTKEMLPEFAKLMQFQEVRIQILHHDFGIVIPEPRWDPSFQKLRRSLIAAARNRLMTACLGQSEWVLWLDGDLDFYPKTLLKDLLSANKQIIVPSCILPNGQIFDLNTFCFDLGSPIGESAKYLIDGLYQPPRGVGRRYLDEYTKHNLIRVDAVGGTALLIDANLHREGLIFPTYSYRGYIETEGLAAMAQDMGVQCWGLPQLKIIHSYA